MTREQKNEYARKYYALNKSKINKYTNNWRQNNLEKVNKLSRDKYDLNKVDRANYIRQWRYDNKERSTKMSKKAFEKSKNTLSDSYIIKMMKKQGLFTEKITPEIIELKRITLKTKRLCLQLKN